MLARIEPRPLAGTIPAIPSKSHVHRLLLVAAAADRPTLIRCAAFSADMDATARCLPALGASALRTAEGYLVTPGAAGTAEPTVDCGESGTTFRLLLPMTCALGKSVQFLRAGRLPSRPLSPLYEKCRSLHSINAILSLPFQKSPVIPARPTRLPCCRRAEQAPFPSPASRFHLRKHSRRTSGAAKRRADTP